MQEDRLLLEANPIFRLDRMPMNKEIRLLVGLLVLRWGMEALDIGMIGQVATVLKQLWNLVPEMAGPRGSCSTMGVFSFMAVAFGIAIVALWLGGQETARRSVDSTVAGNMEESA